MTQVGNVYGEALYDLARSENLDSQILAEITALKESFTQEPDFLRLMAAPNVPKEERCQILDSSFREKVHPYVLNFLKILTEKGYTRQFPQCCDAYRGFYNEDNGILVVKAMSAVALNEEQKQKLIAKLEVTTGKQIDLQCSVDPAELGGLRLSYSGKMVDGTVKTSLDSIGKLLQNTVL